MSSAPSALFRYYYPPCRSRQLTYLHPSLPPSSSSFLMSLRIPVAPQRLLLVQPPLDRRTGWYRNRYRRRSHLVVGAVDGVEKEVSRAQQRRLLGFFLLLRGICWAQRQSVSALWAWGECVLQSKGRLMRWRSRPSRLGKMRRSGG